MKHHTALRPRHPMFVRLLLALSICVVGVAASAAPAAAGGWAVTTLDATPSPVPGEPVDVGFTIRQHGVTPVDLDDVFIAVVAADGTVATFPATLQGPTGHYIATVTIPDAGTYTWRVNQGWFAPQDLGELTVAASTVQATPSAAITPATPDASTQAPTAVRVVETTHSYPAIARYGLPALALVFGAMAIADIVMRRRHRRDATVVA